MCNAEDVARARNRALRLLGVRDRSCHEMKTRLLRAGFSSEVVDAVVTWLKAQGYLDDRAFARNWAEFRRRGKPMGTRRILDELAKKGISRDDAEAALEGGGLEAEIERAYDAAQRFVARMGEIPLAARQRRLAQHLARRGFSGEIVRKIVARVMAT